MKHDEPLLIYLLQKLLDSKNDVVWFKSAYNLHQVEKIGKATIDQPATMDHPKYSGMAYDIKLWDGIGPVISPHDAETQFELVKMDPNPKSSIGQDKQNWALQRVSTRRRVREAQDIEKCCDNPPLVFDLIKAQLEKGTKIRVEFHEQSGWGPFNMNGYDHEGVIKSIRCHDSVSITYDGEQSGDILALYGAAADAHIRLVKRDGELVLVDNEHRLAEDIEDGADEPIWIHLVNMLVRKGERVLMWDGENHDEDGIIVQIDYTSMGTDKYNAYARCTYADFPANGELIGEPAGDMVIDQPEEMRLEKRGADWWLLGSNE